MSFFQEYLDDLVMEKVADYLTEQSVSSQKAEEAALRKARQELVKDKKFINATPAQKKTMIQKMYDNMTKAHSGASRENYSTARGYTHVGSAGMNYQDVSDFGTAGYTRAGQKDYLGNSFADVAGVTNAKADKALAARDKRMLQLGDRDHLHDIGYRKGESLGGMLGKHVKQPSIGERVSSAAGGIHEYLKSKGKYAPHAAYGAAGAAALGGGAYLYNRNKKKR